MKQADQRVRDAFMLVQADGASLTMIAQLIDAGKFRVFVAGIYPLAEARQAYAAVEKGGRHGKVVLSIQDNAALNS